MKVYELLEILKAELEPIYGTREAVSASRTLLSDIWGVDYYQTDNEIEVDTLRLEGILSEIRDYKPISQIVGFSYFYNRPFKVNSSVLTPRGETEELVHWICSNHKASNKPLRILDIGVGSGAIAVTLSLELEGSQVEGVDISSEALAIANTNNLELGGNVSLSIMDILTSKPNGQYDIVVSNPPYIPLSEHSEMCLNVINHEPHTALFVEDSNPLIFYRRIAEVAKDILVMGGSLYFEIHELFESECCEMLSEMGFCDIVSRNDLNDKPRMIQAKKSNYAL